MTPAEIAKLSQSEILKELARRQHCKNFRDFFIENQLWIKDKDGVIRKFSPLKKFQKRMLNLINHIRNDLKKPVRIIVLKARKIGNSTLFAADLYCDVRDNGLNAVIIAHDEKTSKKLLAMAHLFYEKDELIEKPTLARGSINEIVFSNFSGQITVETANNIQAGTGDTIQYLLASECSKWAKGEAVANTLLQAVAKRPSTTVILESTAWGFDEVFQPKWKGAYDNCQVTWDEKDMPTITVTNPDEWNGYVPVFFPSYEDPDCWMAFDTDSDRLRLLNNLDDRERHLLEVVGVNLEYINFRRWTLKNECSGNLDTYNQEWCETPELAFISSGNPRFNRVTLAGQPIEKGRRGRLDLVKTGWAEKIQFVEDSMGVLTVFRMPIVGHRYVGSLDSAEGLTDEQGKNPDATVGHFYDIDNGGEQVAVIRGQIPPEQIVEPYWLLLRWYNMAFAIPERNNTGIHICMALVSVPYSYPADRVYHQDDWDKKGRAMRRRVGFVTGPGNSGTRNRLIGLLATYLDTGQIRFHSAKTQEEMINFVTRDGKIQAQKGFHDDEVFAAGLGAVGMHSYPMDARSLQMAQASGPGNWPFRVPSNKPGRPQMDGYGSEGEL